MKVCTPAPISGINLDPVNLSNIKLFQKVIFVFRYNSIGLHVVIPSLARSYSMYSVILKINMLLNLHKRLKSSIPRQISHMHSQNDKLNPKNVIE